MSMPNVWGLAVTPEVAQQIRSWRVTQRETWRGVAELASEHYRDLERSSNQLLGRDLCAAAAKVLGEDSDAAPWN